MTPPLLEARNLTRILPAEIPVTLVRDVDLVVEPGEFVAITGPSGSGKSSLLYLLGLLDVPSQGSVLLQGHDTGALDEAELAELRLRKIGFVFQFHFLLPEFTLLGNVTLPMRKLAAVSEQRMRARAAEILAHFGLGDDLKKKPDQLSGGERQRVAMARALANDPPLILADEPTGNLDTKNAQIVFDLLATLVKEEGRTVIAVTHDPDLARQASRQIHIVDGRITK